MLHEIRENEQCHVATPYECQWIYINNPMLNIPKFHITFRHRFRLPYVQFFHLLSDATENKWFPCWQKHNSMSPLPLLILGALRYLGQGWTFNDLEGQTLIGQEVHCCFFMPL